MFDVPFTEPLKPKLRNKYIEQLALLILRYVNSEFFSQFKLLDLPDLQSKDGLIAIEVTEAKIEKFARIDGESTKMWYGKSSDEEKEKIKRKIESNGNGGKVIESSVFYPCLSDKEQRVSFENAVRKKMKKLPSYREKSFRTIGLFVMHDDIPIPFKILDSVEWFTNILNEYQDKYDFLILAYRYSVIFYNFSEMDYKQYKIGEDDYYSMCKEARIEVEHTFN